MSKDEEEKRDEMESIDLGLGGLFKGIGDLIDLVSGMVEKVDLSNLDSLQDPEGEETLSRLRRASRSGVGGAPRGVYGLSVQRGVGGIPRVQPFGNIRRTERGPIVKEVTEPLTDLFDEDDLLLVVAELPGVEEKEIRIEVEDDTLKFSSTGKRKYAKELLLPCPVDESTMETTYKNGVLEIRLRKAEEPGEAELK
jgi:HSP20 family protein